MIDLELLAFLAGQTMRISVPYVFAALGGCLAERSGVAHVGLEGMLIAGGLGTVMVTLATGSAPLGVLAGVGFAAVLGVVHATATVAFRADQIVSGLAVNLLAAGIAKFCLRLFYQSASNSPRIEGLGEIPVGALRPIAGIGDALANPLVWLAMVAAAGVLVLLYRTPWGLRVRAVGENPEAADTLGVWVSGTRFAAVVAGSALAALGGVYLALEQHMFSNGMSGGRGFIALAAMILGRWNPVGALAACLLFAFAEALQIRLQGTGVPADLLQTLPYVLTLAVLASGLGRSAAPRAIGQPYEKERLA